MGEDSYERFKSIYLEITAFYVPVYTYKIAIKLQKM